MASAKKSASARSSKGAAVKRSYQRRTRSIDVEIPFDEQQQQSAKAGQTSTNPVVSLEDRLAEIEVIDLRKLPPADRVAVFSMLESLGYLERSTLQAILENQSSAMVAMFAAEALQLNHTNKLVSLVPWEEVKDSYAISRCIVDLHVALEFSDPGPVDPDYMSFGDSHYVRVSKEIRDATISALDIIRKGA